MCYNISQCDILCSTFGLLSNIQIMFHQLNKLYVMMHQLFSPLECCLYRCLLDERESERTIGCADAHLYITWVRRLSTSNMKSIRTVTRLCVCATDTNIHWPSHHFHSSSFSHSIRFNFFFRCSTWHYHHLLFGILFIVDVNIWTKIIYQNVTQEPE